MRRASADFQDWRPCGPAQQESSLPRPSYVERPTSQVLLVTSGESRAPRRQPVHGRVRASRRAFRDPAPDSSSPRSQSTRRSSEPSDGREAQLDELLRPLPSSVVPGRRATRVPHSCPTRPETSGLVAVSKWKPAWLPAIAGVRRRSSSSSARLPKPGVVGSSPIVRLQKRPAKAGLLLLRSGFELYRIRSVARRWHAESERTRPGVSSGERWLLPGARLREQPDPAA